MGSLQRYVTSITGGEGRATYQIYVPEAGPYIVWCRVLASNASSDSFYVSMDGGAEDVYDAAETTYSSSWRWTKINGRAGGNALTLNPRVFTLTAGLHTLVFRQRDPNTGLSRLIVTNDRNFFPADNQPVAGIGTGLTLSNMVLRMSIGTGYSMIANPLSRGGNTVAEVLSSVPNGTQLYKYNPANRAFINNVFQAGNWSNPSQTLSPGEGAFIYNTSGSVISLTFTGGLQINNSPLPLGAGMNFLSAWYPRTGRISEIVNSAPVEGDRLYRFDNGSGNYLIYSYDSEFGGWGDSEPIVRAGSSFYYFKNSNP